MWPFRRVPAPFAVSYLLGGLLTEKIQERKAEKYANQVVHRSDTTIEQHIEKIKNEQASEKALLDRLLHAKPGTDEFREIMLEMNERDQQKYNTK